MLEIKMTFGTNFGHKKSTTRCNPFFEKKPKMPKNLSYFEKFWTL